MDHPGHVAQWITIIARWRLRWRHVDLIDAGLSTYPRQAGGVISPVSGQVVVMLPLRPGLCYRRAEDAAWYRLRPDEAFVMRLGTWQARNETRPYDQLKIAMHDDHFGVVQNTNGVKGAHLMTVPDQQRWRMLLACCAGEACEQHAAVALLLAECFRALQTTPRPTKSERKFQLVCEHLRNHLDHEHSRRQLAAIAQCHPSHLTRLFTTYAGCNYAAWLETERFHLACALMRETDFDLERIARTSGFASANYFIRRFRSAFGSTPGTWRRQR